MRDEEAAELTKKLMDQPKLPKKRWAFSLKDISSKETSKVSALIADVATFAMPYGLLARTWSTGGLLCFGRGSGDRCTRVGWIAYEAVLALVPCILLTGSGSKRTFRQWK